MDNIFNSKRIAGTICGVMALSLLVAANISICQIDRRVTKERETHIEENWHDIYRDNKNIKNNRNIDDILNDILSV